MKRRDHKPDCPSAESYEICFCKGENCGMHIIGHIDDKPMLEIVLNKEQTREMIRLCTAALGGGDAAVTGITKTQNRPRYCPSRERRHIQIKGTHNDDRNTKSRSRAG